MTSPGNMGFAKDCYANECMVWGSHPRVSRIVQKAVLATNLARFQGYSALVLTKTSQASHMLTVLMAKVPLRDLKGLKEEVENVASYVRKTFPWNDVKKLRLESKIYPFLFLAQ